MKVEVVVTRELETFTAGRPQAVDVAAIERELRLLWSEAASSEGSPAVTRATLLNLVVRVASRDGETAAASTVARVASAVPCRALVVVEEAARLGDTPPLETWISAHCTPAHADRRQVCCEQVTIRAQPAAQAHVPALVRRLVQGDLPTVLFWPGDFETPLAAKLADTSDRWIVDTAECSSASKGLATLAAWQAAHPRAEAHDLAWDRLAIWRELTAAFFDAPAAGAEAGDIRRLELEHGARARGAALLFAGWMASRLGWEVETSRSGVWTLRAAKRRRVQLAVAAAGSAAEHDLGGVLLQMRDGTRFVVEAHGATRFESRVEHRAACPLPHVVEHKGLDSDVLLARRLARTSRNRAFRQALAAAAALGRRA